MKRENILILVIGILIASSLKAEVLKDFERRIFKFSNLKPGKKTFLIIRNL